MTYTTEERIKHLEVLRDYYVDGKLVVYPEHLAQVIEYLADKAGDGFLLQEEEFKCKCHFGEENMTEEYMKHYAQLLVYELEMKLPFMAIEYTIEGKLAELVATYRK